MSNRIIKETVNKIIKEDYVDVFDSEYYELIPLFDIFKKGYCFGSDRNELLMTPLCDKNGNDIGYCLNDLQIKYQPY